MHKIFRLDGATDNSSTSAGIVDCLVGDTKLPQAVREISPHEIDTIGGALAITTNLVAGGRLYVLAGGRRAPNPAEILSGPSFGQLIAEAMRHFNRIVIDSAPILAVSDTLLMTPHVQTVCVVLRARKTPRPAVRRAIALLINSGIRPAGLVLNRLPRSRGVGYYYYYASPGYGAGEGSYSAVYAEENGARPKKQTGLG